MPDYILYAQHGWADTNQDISSLGRAIASPWAEVVSPNLGYLNTWWRMMPLIDRVDRIATAYRRRYPETPSRIIGHSMGGLIWLELLNRHPDWWPWIERLTLIGSPVGGADLGRIIDPFQWGIGIARDLGLNRRALAERIALKIPTQIIAGNFDGGSDGLVTLQGTQFSHAQYVELTGLKHAQLKTHPAVARAIQDFWKSPPSLPDPNPIDQLREAVITQLNRIPGITDAHYRDFPKAQVWAPLANGYSLRTWKNPLGVHHVFLADGDNLCHFGGFVGWIHTQELYQTLTVIKETYSRTI
jgi:pimeloyl-ACP methyl ester carboxylesterase